jgi:hypothetical protein
VPTVDGRDADCGFTARGVIVMFAVLAIVLLLTPLAVLYVVERMARAGKGPLAEPDRMTVLDGAIVPMGGFVPLLDPGPPSGDRSLDTERCATESRIVADLIAGTLEPGQYQLRMAALAELDATTRPVHVPPEPQQ